MWPPVATVAPCFPAGFNIAGDAGVLSLREKGPSSTDGSRPSPTLILPARPMMPSTTVVYRFVGEQPRAGRAALSLVVGYRVGGPGDGAVEIRVRKNDGWRFAAEFERHALEVAGG